VPDYRTVALNAALNDINARVLQLSGDPATQMGILAMAQALAFRRLTGDLPRTARNRRLFRQRAVADFDSKLEQFGHAPETKA
jgi:hypothetical protein